MIKRINKIKNFGVFSNYTHSSDLRDFEEKNIIYGWNYSGKTTVSRLISYLDKTTQIDDDYATAEFEVELSDGKKINNTNRDESTLLIKVFNSDFIKNNLHFDSNDEERKITGIKFAVGDTGDILDQIREKEKYIEKASSVIEHIGEPIGIFNSFDRKFSEQAKNLTEILNLGRNFTKTNIKNYITLWNEKDYSDYIINDEKELSRIKTNAIAQNTGIVINTDAIPKTSFTNLLADVELILKKQPKKSNEDLLLASDNDLYNWAKTGLIIYNEKRTDLKKCAFCGSSLLDKRLQDLNAFYSNEASKVKNEIEQLKTKIDSEKSRFTNLEWSKKSENDLAQSIQADFIQKKNEYNQVLQSYINLLEQLSEKLDEKAGNSLFISMELGTIDSSSNDAITAWINSVQQIFIQSNAIINEFEQKQNDAKEKYKEHYIASFLINENYKGLEAKKNTAEKRVEKIKQRIIQNDVEIKELNNKLDSVDKGKEELTLFIKRFLNRDDLVIDVTEDKYFVLNRNGKIASHLSDGEKSAIAFSHFMVELKSLKDEDNLKNYIVFIDDPISSLDANHIAQVYSLIISFFFQKGLDVSRPDKNCLCAKQLFISTHNFEFYSFINKATLLGNNKQCAQFLIRHINENQSEIVNMPKSISMYNSEYVYLFSEIENFKNENYPEEKAYIMPNIVRRFLEIYTLMKLPGNRNEIDNRLKILFEDKFSELKILHNFSHFTSFDRATKHSELILRIRDVIEDLYKILENDTAHLESLREGIKN